MMKKTQKVTRLKLSIDQNSNYLLYGLVSAEPDYKLSLALNKKFRISLRNIQSINPDGDDGVFSKYSDVGDPDKIAFNLISNRSGKKHLLNKLKNIDYLLQIILSDNEDIGPDDILSDLRQIENITAVFNIEVGKIKDKNLHYLNQ